MEDINGSWVRFEPLWKWSGCIGIRLERWASAFYAQKGLDVDGWPEAFREIVGSCLRGFGSFRWVGDSIAICSCGILYGVYRDCYILPYSPFIVSTISL